MTSVLVDHLIELVAMHEANAVVLYSDKLSAQIPRSYAANAFRRFQTSMAGSCPTAWCSFLEATTMTGLGREDQAARVGRLSMGSSPIGAMLSSVM